MQGSDATIEPTAILVDLKGLPPGRHGHVWRTSLGNAKCDIWRYFPRRPIGQLFVPEPRMRIPKAHTRPNPKPAKMLRQYRTIDKNEKAHTFVRRTPPCGENSHPFTAPLANPAMK